MAGDKEKLAEKNQRTAAHQKKFLYNNYYLPLGSAQEVIIYFLHL